VALRQNCHRSIAPREPVEYQQRPLDARLLGEPDRGSMISIDDAYEALKARNPGMDQDQTSRGRNGQLRIWVDRTFLDQLLAARRPGESYSDVIMRLAEG
jgi:hypothetical protein